MNNYKKKGENRQSLIAKIHIAQPQLGFDNDTYRDFLSLHGNGKTSCTDMTVPELFSVYNAFIAAGFKPRYKKKSGTKDKEKPFARPNKEKLMNKIEALLTDGNKPWAYAEAIAKQMCGKQRLQWCTPAELNNVMIALQKQQRKQKNKEGSC
ncbi:MAG: regulatory protein GemA [Gammaproteobacteria bacterium]|nr:regulatory protein GemA [Gammaproteobacteria bacterium]